jgi:hypothetical protein
MTQNKYKNRKHKILGLGSMVIGNACIQYDFNIIGIILYCVGIFLVLLEVETT